MSHPTVVGDLDSTPLLIADEPASVLLHSTFGPEGFDPGNGPRAGKTEIDIRKKVYLTHQDEAGLGFDQDYNWYQIHVIGRDLDGPGTELQAHLELEPHTYPNEHADGVNLSRIYAHLKVKSMLEDRNIPFEEVRD